MPNSDTEVYFLWENKISSFNRPDANGNPVDAWNYKTNNSINARTGGRSGSGGGSGSGGRSGSGGGSGPVMHTISETEMDEIDEYNHRFRKLNKTIDQNGNSLPEGWFMYINSEVKPVKFIYYNVKEEIYYINKPVDGLKRESIPFFLTHKPSNKQTDTIVYNQDTFGPLPTGWETWKEEGYNVYSKDKLFPFGIIQQWNRPYTSNLDNVKAETFDFGNLPPGWKYYEVGKNAPEGHEAIYFNKEEQVTSWERPFIEINGIRQPPQVKRQWLPNSGVVNDQKRFVAESGYGKISFDRDGDGPLPYGWKVLKIPNSNELLYFNKEEHISSFDRPDKDGKPVSGWNYKTDKSIDARTGGRSGSGGGSKPGPGTGTKSGGGSKPGPGKIKPGDTR